MPNAFLLSILRHSWTFSKYWTGGWLLYYLVCDTHRRLIIRHRARRLRSILSKLESFPQDSALSSSHRELLASEIQRQFAPISFLGRYWNPFPEWREAGAWEAFAKWGVTLFEMATKVDPSRAERRLNKGRTLPGLEAEKIDWEKIWPWGKPGQESAVEEEDDRLLYTWIGQSTSHLTLSRLRILTDPTFSQQTIDMWGAPWRLRPVPCGVNDLGKIDLVLVSHNHYDHLEAAAVTAIGDSAVWIIPTGVGKFIHKCGVSWSRIVEMTWWEVKEMELEVAGGGEGRFKITCTPNMHWTARSPLDTNTTLSASFLIESVPSVGSNSRARSFFHTGDTGYSPTLFKAIGQVLDRPIDCASIPIGSYEPRWAMSLQHTDPEGAVNIAKHLRVKKSFAAHWGTWVMSDEPYDKPPKDLALARTKLGMPESDFEVLPVGRTVVVE